MVYLVARLFRGVRTVLSFYRLRRHSPVFFPREQTRFLVSPTVPVSFGIIRERSPFYRSLRPRHSTLISRPSPCSPFEQQEEIGAPTKAAAPPREQRSPRVLRESEKERKKADGIVTRSWNPWGDWKLYRDRPLRADDLTALTCPHFSAYHIPVSRRPRVAW